MKWPEGFINQIICGDCLKTMRGIPDNSIDTIITDPPYGIGFMGKEWDNFKSGFIDSQQEKNNEDYLQNIKRKQQYPNLKGRKLSPIGTRSSISGSYDLSPKGLMGFQKWTEAWATQALRVAKPGSTLLCFGGTRTYHRLACAIEDAGWIIKDCIIWLYGSGFPKATDISKQIDKKAGKLKTQGKGFVSAGHDGRKAEMKQTLKYRSDYGYKYKPKGEESQIWEGWKSHGLKPAYEPILVAMKPNEGSYANNALKWGVAGLDIDGGRIPLNGDKPRKANKGKSSTNIYGWAKGGINKSGEMPVKGRYPANVILDEESARMLDEQSGERKPPWGKESESQNDTSWFSGKTDSYGKLYRDTGGASRFFYCAKASKAERNRGCEGLETKQKYNKDGSWNSHEIFSEYRTDPKTGELKKRKETDNDFKNHHPTVKPLSLMKYLCTLTKTPTGGIVLDPFCGSGTTLMACEELKRDYIGIDNNPEYCEIARKRVNAIPESLF